MINQQNKAELHQEEQRLLAKLRELRRAHRQIHEDLTQAETSLPLTLGQRFADAVTTVIGSWRFIIIQSTLLFCWIVLNVLAYVHHWDPYPFILLNLALSFQAAYAAPFIMMSQNRQQEIDRKFAQNDYRVNIKAELEIELLHQKLDQLRETEVMYLTQAVRELTEIIRKDKLS
jgi:uncharacterized membrane protein